MNPRSPAPLFKALIPFIFGILCTIYFGIINPFYILIVCVPFLFWLSLQILWPDTFATYSNRWTTGISAYFIFFCCGYSASIVNSEIHDNNHFSKVANVDACIGIVKDAPVEKEKSFKTYLEISAVIVNGKQVNTIGKCLTWFSKDSLSKAIKYGDEIVFITSPIEVPQTPNPGQFNYKQFLSYRNIFHQVYLKTGSWKIINHHKGNPFFEMALNLRERLLKVFKENKIEGQDYAVLSALTLGDEDEINQGTMNAFAASGTMHILSVSGMHVGIIFLALNTLLFFMNRKQSLKIIKSLILIFLLGSYALITGLSPPVLRSAIMLALIIVGSELGRQKVTLNIVAASAIALLSYNPFYIMDVGFQLSYLCIIGIVLLYEKINGWFHSKYRIVKKVWSITSISIAAQLATFPLCFFYFHQFPNYFLVSNLVIIPLSEYIIYSGIALLACFWWTSGIFLLGKIVGGLVHALISIAVWIEHLPYALISKVSVSVIEVYLIYTAILLLIFFFSKKQYGLLLGFACTFAIILIIQIIETIEIKSQRQIVIFNVPKNSVVSFIDGRKNYLLADTLLIHNESAMRFNIRPYFWDRGLADESIIKTDNGKTELNEAFITVKNGFIRFHEKKIVMIDCDELLRCHPANKIKVDYIIITKNPKVRIKELLSVFDVQKIIFDSSNSLYHCTKWEQDCKNLNVEYYTVQKHGALVIDV